MYTNENRSQVSGDQTMRGAASVGRYKYDRERKLGHRRIGEGGQITYKKIETTQLMGSIQLGIQHTVCVIDKWNGMSHNETDFVFVLIHRLAV